MSSSPDVPTPPEPSRYAAEQASVASDRERWSARRTALVAGVTILLVSAGTIAAAATVPLGDTSRGDGSSREPRLPPLRYGAGPDGHGPQQDAQPRNSTGQRPDGSQLPQVPARGRTAGPAAGGVGTRTWATFPTV